jgi:hypothetical protein
MRSNMGVIMKKILIGNIDELSEEICDIIELYEDPPKGANPEDDDDPYIGEDGTLVLDTKEIEIEATFDPEEFPDNITVYVNYIGWDYTDERAAAVYGMETHEPAEVYLTLRKKWNGEDEESLAIYDISI